MPTLTMNVLSETLHNNTTPKRISVYERVEQRRSTLSALKVREEQVESPEEGREAPEGVGSVTDSSRNGYDKFSDGDYEIGLLTNGSVSDASSEEGVNDVGASASRDTDPAVNNLFRAFNPAASNISGSFNENNRMAEEYEEAAFSFNTITTSFQKSSRNYIEYLKQANEHSQGQLASQGDEQRRLRFELKMAEAKVGELEEKTQGLNKELQVKDDLIVNLENTNQFLEDANQFVNDENSVLKESLDNAKGDYDDLKKTLKGLMRHLVGEGEVEP